MYEFIYYYSVTNPEINLIFQYLGKLSIVLIVIISKSYLVAEFLFRAEWKQKLYEFTYYLAMNPNFPISYLKFSKSSFFFSRSEKNTLFVDNRASSPIIAIPKAKLISYREYGGAKAAHHRDVGFSLEEGRRSIVSIHLVAHPLPLSSIIHCTRAGASVSR